MTTPVPQSMSSHEDNNKPSFGAKAAFFFQGFYLPCLSRNYYRRATQKPLISAIGFFIIFGLFVALVSVLLIGITMGSLQEDIQTFYESGEFPTIIIEDGVARTDGEQQFFFTENRTFFGIDTTGGVTEIDTLNFSQGILLTRSDVHLVNEDGYQIISLAEMNQAFGNPIMIDKSQILLWWTALTSFMLVFIFLGIFLLFTFFWFIVILLFGLVIWGFVSLKRPGYDFSSILIVGLYAYIPTTYLDFILNKLGLEFCSMQIGILLIIWILILRWLLKEQNLQEGLGGEQANPEYSFTSKNQD